MIWFFLIYVAIILCIIFILFVFGIVPVTVTYKDGSVKKYNIIDIVKLWS